jgi:hypothetical protein
MHVVVFEKEWMAPYTRNERVYCEERVATSSVPFRIVHRGEPSGEFIGVSHRHLGSEQVSYVLAAEENAVVVIAGV